MSHGTGLRVRSGVPGASRLDPRADRHRDHPARTNHGRLSGADRNTIRDHLRERVQAQGLWGAFLDENLGGLGWGQLKLALMSEQIGRSMWSMVVFGVQAPDSGNMELLAHDATEEQKERWLWPNYRGEITSAFALTEPHMAGADPASTRRSSSSPPTRPGSRSCATFRR